VRWNELIKKITSDAAAFSTVFLKLASLFFMVSSTS
jgi:hypothetical protein